MTHVNSIFDLAKHVSEHRKRVYILGMGVEGPKFLKMIIFGLHDIEKYIFLYWLWKYYGPKGAKGRGNKLFARMNKLGRFIISTIFFFLPFDEVEINKLKRFERIVDVIDRHCDPVALEEFNLAKKRPLTNFIKVSDLPDAITLKKKWIERFGIEGKNI